MLTTTHACTHQEHNVGHFGGNRPAARVENKSRHSARRHGGKLRVQGVQETDLPHLDVVVGGVWREGDVPSQGVLVAVDVAVDDAVEAGDADVDLQLHFGLENKIETPSAFFHCMDG